MERNSAMKDKGSALEKLRASILSNGVRGIRTIARTFRRLDENGDKRIDFAEFESTLDDHGVNVDTATKRQCFDEMDLDGSGAVNFDEFLIAMRPPLSESRLHVIDQAFDKMDVDKSGVVTLDDIRGTYSAEWHPKYKSGEWTADQVFHHWLTNFGGADDGTVTKEDFVNYYVAVSSSVDDDEYFEAMMNSAWKL
ncbi:hypothetical protein LSAT2_007869 [Lamellibrachia satsuma]|nr:hypothetical protein LSAT2_007869 [Lamellibrachia satsuma]